MTPAASVCEYVFSADYDLVPGTYFGRAEENNSVSTRATIKQCPDRSWFVCGATFKRNRMLARSVER